MEYNPPFKLKCIFAIFISIFTINSCGYFDEDKIENKISVAGRLKIIKIQNDSTYSLVLSNENNGRHRHIVNNCQNVFYDRINNIIYSDEFLNDNYIIYHKLVIIDSASYEKHKAIKIQEIDKSKFDKINKNGMRAWKLQDK